MNKQFILICITCLVMIGKTQGQIDKYNTVDLHPVSPSAFQFQKYIEMPVSEYTGIPNISIPIYEIVVDEVKIPINLTYHSQGIRVSQEASWVGLGWDLSIGSIVQTINDRDDYGSDPLGMVRRLPDYFPCTGDGSPTLLPMRYKDPFIINGDWWQNPYPITTPQFQQGFAIATKYYVPVSGQFDQPQTGVFTQRNYDSEPDIFVANFLGETVKFTTNFDNLNQPLPKVLNSRAYKVNKTTNGFNIINPSGTTFYFETKSVIQNSTSTLGLEGYINGVSEDVSIIYFLSKIITKNGKLIDLGYSSTDLFTNYPMYSSKLQVLTAPTAHPNSSPPSGGGSYQFINADFRSGSGFTGTGSSTTSINQEHYFNLNSISFPNGSINFQISDRNDITGSKKLDQIQLKTLSNDIIRSWTLNYSYFDATNISSYGYDSANLTSQARSSLRLKLANVTVDDGGVYSFIYDETPLPKKNSFAQDYWGFYNGKLTNTSLNPNPFALNLDSLGNNGNDKNADVIFTQAGILKGIIYPTGGKVTFDYELNEFSKYDMWGLPSSSLTVRGAGLRIHTISHYSSPTTLSTKNVYSYEGGILINPIQLVRQVNYTVLNQWYPNYGTYYMETTDWILDEISANGVFASNPLGSINGVGYSKVINWQVDGNNISNGKIETEFYNHYDTYNPTIASRVVNCNIPTVKSNIQPENGSVHTITVFNQSHPIRTTINTYQVISSELYYGARIMGYGSLCYEINVNDVKEQIKMPQNVIGYYPIFDIETLLTNTVTTEKDDNDNEIVTSAAYGYDGYGQSNFKQTRTSADGYLEEYYDHAYEYYLKTGQVDLLNKNLLSEVTAVRSQKRKSNYNEYTDIVRLDKEFTTIGGKVVLTKSTLQNKIAQNEVPRKTTFDLYDNDGNLLQFSKDGRISAFIWDYNNEYIISEIKNAAVSQVAYSSFEANGKGGWNYSGTITTDVASPTGRKYYTPSSGNEITRSGLNNNITYILSYWSTNPNSYSIPGTSVSRKGFTVGNWSYYEHEITGISSISIGGTGNIDEVRLYPKGALMTTYSYEPLIGMTSQCDANNRIVYYIYDSVKRLSIILDQNKKVIKKFCYNYAGQTENCN